MKIKISSLYLAALAVCIVANSSCMTTYDTYGRPVRSVDPVVAVAGVAAAGLIGLAAGADHHHGGYYGGGYYGGGYGPCY